MFNRGLSTKEAIILKKQFGDNLIPAKEENSKLKILFSQLNSPLIYILIIVGFVSFIFKEYFDAGLISFVIAVNITLGFYQEYKAKNTLAVLKNVLKPTALVIRDGERKEILSKDIVPGDLIVLGSGDRISADGKLIEGTNLLVSEAILTGEEEAITKNAKDNNKLLYMGTIVLSGSAIMEVTKIGTKAEMGKIGQGIQEIKEVPTPLQVKFEKFAKNLAIIVLLICVLIFVFGVIRGENPLTMLRMSIILSIAAIPEGLPISITMILALGMRRILKKKGLVKTLLSIETLGSTSVICTDKTGTLTEGKMKVVKTDFQDQKQALLALILDNEQRSSLELALWEYVKTKNDFKPQKIFDETERIFQEPFDSEKKYSMTINKLQGQEQAYLLGAPEIVLSFCKLAEGDRNKFEKKITNWAEEGLRVLAVAGKIKGDLKSKTNFIWLGLVGIADPIRLEVPEAIKIAQKAGIKIKIVTGDYRKTAEKIARNLGFNLNDSNIIEGEELNNITKDELRERIDQIILFARVTPQQKLMIVKVLQEKGEVVAMTGDGVNDAPALKQANIGIAVGNASDVAKEASDIILLDSNFKTIVDVIKEGRLVFSNIKKTTGYVLSNSFAEIILIFGTTILNFPPPLLVVQILWINLICDGPIDLSLAFEPKENSLMVPRPQDIQKEGILSGLVKSLIIVVSFTTGIITLILYWYFGILQGNLILGRTLAFAMIASVSLIYVFAYKNLHKPIFLTEKFFCNKFIFVAVLFGFLIIGLAIYWPFLNNILSTIPLLPYHWILIFGATLVVTLFVELTKFMAAFSQKNPRFIFLT